MSFNSLARLTLGRLRRGAKGALSMLTLGRLRSEEDEKEKEVFIQPGAMDLSGVQISIPDPVNDNNVAVLLTCSSLV